LGNRAGAIRALVARLVQLALESTGGYERPLLEALAMADFPWCS
jgi:hypothetical protein